MKSFNSHFIFLLLISSSSPVVAAKEYEFIVVGAGSAGSIVAGQLAKNAGAKVLLIEAGGDNFDPHIRDIYMDNYFKVAFNTYNFEQIHWGYSSTEQTMVGAAPTTPPQSKVLNLPRGKALGGTHSINAGAYVQASSDDFNDIATELNDNSWQWSNTQTLRTQLEDALGIVELGKEQVGALDYIEAAEDALGIPFNPDPLSGQQYGISPSFWTAHVDENGHATRRTSFDAFVMPMLMNEMSNATQTGQGFVDVVTNHLVENLIFDPSDNTKVVGVSCINTRAKNMPTPFYATKEVIVSAGTYNSPHLLLNSGIGPQDHLNETGITLRHNLPGVGSNLRDHHGVATYWNLEEQPFDAPFLFQSPILNIFGPETTGRTKYQMEISGNFGNCRPLQQDSHGTVRLQSNSPFDPPTINPNLLSTANDVDTLVDCVRDYLLPFWEEIIDEDLVSVGNLNSSATDGEIRDFVIQNVASDHHPVGTCKVGPDGDPMAVVDKDFKVRGLSGLRVVDASVFPKPPSGNINAPTMTIAMLAAEKIKQEHEIIILRRRRGLRAVGKQQA